MFYIEKILFGVNALTLWCKLDHFIPLRKVTEITKWSSLPKRNNEKAFCTFVLSTPKRNIGEVFWTKSAHHFAYARSFQSNGKNVYINKMVYLTKRRTELYCIFAY